jgi:hypothetical protein
VIQRYIPSRTLHQKWSQLFYVSNHQKGYGGDKKKYSTKFSTYEKKQSRVYIKFTKLTEHSDNESGKNNWNKLCAKTQKVERVKSGKGIKTQSTQILKKKVNGKCIPAMMITMMKILFF